MHLFFRSFLTGRSPLHHGEFLSKADSDDIDLRWTWISEKLSHAGYESHWYGKAIVLSTICDMRMWFLYSSSGFKMLFASSFCHHQQHHY